MNRILQKGQIVILIIILISGMVYLAKPAYADGISVETSYLTKATKFYSAKKGGRIRLRWSKAFARLQDGSIQPVSGYQIQYSTKKDFSRHKTITKGKNATTALIKLKKLNTRQKYKKNIKKYNIRIRSFVTVGGKKYYSKWNKAAKQKKVRVYFPVGSAALTAEENVVTLSWSTDSPTEGYIIYNKETGDKGWTQRKIIKNKKTKKFVDTVKYGTHYDYIVLGYNSLTTKNPGNLKASCFDTIELAGGAYKVAADIEEFIVGIPEPETSFKGSKLTISWEPSKHAEFYFVEVSDRQDFSNIVAESKVEKAEDSGNFKETVKDLKEKTPYYIRVRAAGKYMDGIRYSDYSEVQTAQYDSKCYTIKFIGNSASTGKMGSILVERDEDFQLPANTYTREGYVFAGWSTGKNTEVNMKEFTLGKVEFGDQQIVRNLAETDETITLYACWKGAGPVAAADWAIRVTKDDTFYYGPNGDNHKCYFCHDENYTFNCNCFCAASYQHGMPDMIEGFAKRKENGNYSQRNGSTEPKWWSGEGFTVVGTNIAVSEIQKGDIICCHNGKRWSHVMIAASATKVAHAAKRGTGPDTITLTNMATKLPKYKKYTVLRLVI